MDVIINATAVPTTAELQLDLGELFGHWERLGKGNLTKASIVFGTTVITITRGRQAGITDIPLTGEEPVEVVMSPDPHGGRRARAGFRTAGVQLAATEDYQEIPGVTTLNSAIVHAALQIAGQLW